MIVVFLFEMVIIVLGATILVTQVVIPAIKNQPSFPILRGRRKLETQLSEANEKVEDNELNKKIASTLEAIKANNKKKK